MSITKSYNRKTNTYYAYETTYEWDDTKQRKVQKKRCVGQFDPKTGKVVPNGRVGRPSIADISKTKSSERTGKKEVSSTEKDQNRLQEKLAAMEDQLRKLSGEARNLSSELDRIADSIKSSS